MVFPRALLSFCLMALMAAAGRAETLTLHGSATVAQALAAAAPVIKEALGLELRIGTEGGSVGGIRALGAEIADLAISTRALDGNDRALFPEMSFHEEQVGWQVVVPVVAPDVWKAGVRGLSKEELQGIYEGRIRNWKEVGGHDKLIKFYNPERGRSIWELFATWLYVDLRKAPQGVDAGATVTAKDARDAVEFNTGSMTLLPPQMADGKAVVALGVRQADGTILEPTHAALAAGKYPIARPLYIISGRRFAGMSKRLVEFLTGPRGGEALNKAGFMPLHEAGAQEGAVESAPGAGK